MTTLQLEIPDSPRRVRPTHHSGTLNLTTIGETVRGTHPTSQVARVGCVPRTILEL
jgi:hypothetical protein